MLQNIVLFLLTNQFSIAISQNLSGVAGFFQRHFAGTDNLRIVSIILLLLAFILFLFLVVILYIKSLLSFIKNDALPSVSGGRANTSKISKDLENEKERELGLEQELEKSWQRKQTEQQRRQAQMETERKRLANVEKELAAKYKKAYVATEQKNKEKQLDFNNTIPFPASTRGRASSMEFDWKKGRRGELDEIAAGIEPFKYVPDKKPLDALTGLIINMLGRDIDDGKIAQTIKTKSGDLSSEDDIIQLIGAIKNFISLNNNGKFANLPEADELPSADEALYSLTQGEPGYCLTMLESLIDNNIDRGHQQKNTQKKDITFLETSNYACTFGTLASLQDLQLATGAFELAIELSPKNINAWSRVGDMYARAESDNKAIWAYNNVMNMGDENLYPHQMANAYKHLSQYYYDQGDVKQAANLYNSSNDYYATIGINQDLTVREQEIINIIESNQDADMPNTINKLLNLAVRRQRGYES